MSDVRCPMSDVARALTWVAAQRRFFRSLMRSTTQSRFIARAPTGRPKIAQGNALGWSPFVVKALKGRPNRPRFGRPFRAPSSIGPCFPGRCPGLSSAAPLGLVNDQPRSDGVCRRKKETALSHRGCSRAHRAHRQRSLSHHFTVASFHCRIIPPLRATASPSAIQEPQ
jgi:hypothetical protein